MKKCGYISIIGRPNVGKSTLLNNILKYKISITSRKPQTTRHQITGIKTLGDTQFIYVDTPGIHIDEPKAINKFMNKAATAMVKEVDVILFVVELGKWTELEDNIVEKLKHSQVPIFLVVNKVDKKKSLEASMFIESIKEKLSFYDVIYVSAKQGHNVNELESRIEKLLPESEYFFYEDDQITDRSIKFMVAEIIREKIMRTIGNEVPYQITVEIDSYKVDQEKNIVDIYASILVERDSQKGIVIGAKGTKLKKIGTDSRIDIERLVGMKVNLKTHVKVKSGWSDDERALKSLGYDLI
ncbi:GTPase Era [Francisella philomiragia]|uniref:GTPase Era n=1 Tax=Francisella philomiragia subsp. philomiragia (strain ATCC 25017 / CCUG 19701 / FSC 153 / O\|nr:GTPase Era [Francisella philomiragia]AJI47913.1 GTP-binding protein Era [Francisella philomiragia]AJI49875.1 GTP-binding protein Era [Francisella philomiragia]MBK2020232.1 GTPase Era [Francisella philomiragia]MBK2031266.1 GTPase Era [Francisella philomiragia]MBK2264146.1 GTPase Era [Francisella philomiragia]